MDVIIILELVLIMEIKLSQKTFEYPSKSFEYINIRYALIFTKYRLENSFINLLFLLFAIKI